MDIKNTLISIDRSLDYIPLASTIVNLVDLFQKYVVFPLLNEQTIDDNHYFSYLNDKSTARCLILLIPLLGNIVIAIHDLANSSEDSAQGESPHISSASVIQSEKEPVKNKCTLSMVHFHQIYSEGESKIFLGNDFTRDHLMQPGTDIASLKNGYNRCHDFGIPNLPEQIEDEIKNLSKIDLLISFNGRVTGDQIAPHDPLDIPGLTHLQHPISEVEDCYESALEFAKLEPIFNAVDTALNQNQSVFFHCSVGEHRSAAILVLYLTRRMNCSFQNAHALVSSKRDIKPYEDNHVTLMTTAYRMYSRGI